MSTVTVQLPDSLKQGIEELSAREGFSVDQFMASAAGEKLAVMKTMDYLRREAAAGRREDFEKFLAAVPDVPPIPGDELWFQRSRITGWRRYLPLPGKPDFAFAGGPSRQASGISWSLKRPIYGCASGSPLRFQKKSPATCLTRIRHFLQERHQHKIVPQEFIDSQARTDYPLAADD